MEQEYRIDPRTVKLVDNREPEAIRIPLLETGWIQKQLWSGDFSLISQDYKKIGITRKSVPDLLQSIGSYFNRQLEEMLDYFDYNWILIEGPLQFNSQDRKLITNTGVSVITIDQVRNYLADWQHKGFMLDRTSSQEDTVKWLNNKYAYYRKPVHAGMKTKFADDRVYSLPSGVRGKSGIALLEKFGSIKAIANAGIDDYMGVDGIGAKRAKNIFEHFNRRAISEVERRDQDTHSEHEV